MHTISRYVPNRKKTGYVREYKHVSDILTTHATSENNSYIVFKDGTQWEYPWGLFTLNMVLAYIMSSQAVKQQRAREEYIQTMQTKEYEHRLYTLALAYVPDDNDVESVYDVLKDYWKEERFK